MTLLLDTTVLIDILRGKKSRRTLLAELVNSGHTLATSAINLGEVYAGMRPEEEAQTELFLGTLDCYPITVATAKRAGKLKAAFAQKGKTLTLADMIVAATAQEHGLTLMTDNRKDFPLSDIEFYSLH